DLVALAPEVILAQSSGAIAPLLQATRTIPIVFTLVADPVGAGFVDSLARPGGNATGFTNFEYAISAKWLELLKDIAPGVTRVAVLRESYIAAGPAQFGVIQSVASSLGIELRPDRYRRRCRDRARDYGFRAGAKRWRDRHRQPGGRGSSQADRGAGGAAPTANHLQLALFRRRWRPDLVWAWWYRSVSPGRPQRR